MTLEAIKYDGANHSLQILDQLLLPHESVYEEISTIQDGWDCIRKMKVRGAPAIAIVAVLSICVELKEKHRKISDIHELKNWMMKSCDYLQSSRPTAVNLTEALQRLRVLMNSFNDNSIEDLVFAVWKFGDCLLSQDIIDNKAIGKHGAEWLISKSQNDIRVLTHCNTGSLATAGYGTALGIIRALNEKGSLVQVFNTETRPYNQGSRLTAYELVVDKLPSPTLICDSMAAALMSVMAKKNTPISAVIVGADRVASNGDTANKIGTYALAIAAKYHGVLFMVAAPTTSIDLNIESGAEIPIEERKKEEMVEVQGLSLDFPLGSKNKLSKVVIAPSEINVWNPGFDITPASLIDVIITEKGPICKQEGKNIFDLK